MMNECATSNQPLCMFMKELLTEKGRNINSKRLQENKQRYDTYLIVNDNARSQQLVLFKQGALLGDASENSVETSSSSMSTFTSGDNPA